MARRIAGLVMLGAFAALSLAAPAAASTASSTWYEDGSGCRSYANTFTAAPGERNVVTVAAVREGVGDPFGIGVCTDVSVEAFTLSDPGATIRPQGSCRFLVGVTNRAVICTPAGLSVWLGDKDDFFTSSEHATVSCGPGNDTVVGPVTAAPDCEQVHLR